MNVLSAWLGRRKQRRAVRKCIRKFIAGIRRIDFEREASVWIDFYNTDFAALWADYAIALGNHPEPLTQEEKKQAFLNHVLEKQEKPICRIFSRR